MKRSRVGCIVVLLLVFAIVTPFILAVPTDALSPTIIRGEQTRTAHVYNGDPSVAHSPTNVIPGTGYQAWTNPLNIYALDYLWASVSATGATTAYSNTLSVEEYGFALPLGAVVSGVQVNIYVLASHNDANNYVTDYFVKLMDGGTPVGSNLAYTTVHYSNTGRQMNQYGANGYMWGAGTNYWTPTKVDSTTFGVYYQLRITAAAGVTVYGYVDYVDVTIYFYTCLWPSSSGARASAGASPFSWGTSTQQTGYVGCVGQQIITNNGDSLYGYMWADTSGNLLLGVRAYNGSGSMSLQIWASGGWGNQQGVSVSQMIYQSSYDWLVIASRQASTTGIQFAVVRVTEPATIASNPVVTLVGTYTASYAAGSSFYSTLNVYLVPQGTYGQAYASYSYGYTDFTGRFGIENVRLNNVWGGTPTTAVNDIATAYDQPVYVDFAYSTSNSILYGMYGMVYFQTGATSRTARLEDFTTGGWISPNDVTFTSKYPSGPMTFHYDQQFNVLLASFPTQDALQDIWIYKVFGGATTEVYPADPVGTSVYDWLDLAGTENNHGIMLIMGLWSDYHSRYKYTLDMGQTWSSWTVTPDSASPTPPTNVYYAQKIALPYNMQPSGYTPSQQGYSSMIQIENGDRIEWVNFFYSRNSMTITGVLPIVAISVTYQSFTVSANALTTMSGTQTLTVATITYVTSDPPITLIAYAIMLILSCVVVAMIRSRSLLSMMTGLTLGVTMACTLGLLQIWFIIPVLIAVVAMLFFGRSGGGGSV